MSQRLAEQELTLIVEDSALRKIAEVGFDPLFGARPLKRAIQNDIENPLAQHLLAGDFAKGTNITMKASEIGFEFKAS